jgi:hypothetical protein
VSKQSVRLMRAASIAAALSLVAAGGSTAGSTAPSAAPPKLVGRWTRTVTAADLARTPSNFVQIGSVWTLIVKKNGAFLVGSAQTVGAIPGTIVPAGATRVHIKGGTPAPDVYGWRVSGKRLTFTKIKDTDADRAVVFLGTWHRES